MAPRNFYRNQKIKRQEQKLVTKDDDDFSKKKSTKMMRKAKDRIERRNQDLLDADQDVIIIRRLERAEKTKQTHEALIKNIDDCEELSKIARSSLGPSGSHKLVFKLFLNELVVQLQHPAPKVLLLAAKQQLKKFGDGAVLVVSIAGQHLEGAKKLIKMGLNPRHIIHGYKKASKKVGEILEALVQEGSETMDVRNKDQVILRMNAPVSSEVYYKKDLILSLIAEACIQVCPKNPVNFNVDNVRVARLLGLSLGASKTFRGMVLKVDTVAGSIKRIHDAKVLVIDGGVDTTDSEQLEEVIKASRAKVIVSGGCGAGLGQKALQFCDDNEIMVLKIASNSEFDCFCRTTDAVPLLKLGSTIDPNYLGHVDSILVEKTRGDRVTVTNKEGGVATILLGGTSTNIRYYELLQRAVVCCVNTYKALCRDSRIVPGAGATEFEIARQLRVFACKETGSSSDAITKYAESFELIPKTLAENSHLYVEDIMKNLKADHEAGKVKVGIDVEEGVCKDSSTLKIWDLYTTKYQALQYAADAVCNALSVIDQDREPQSMFDRLMAEHHVGDQSLGQQHELPPKELLSIFYDSIWANNLQLKREVEMLAVKIHGDKLFGLSPDGRLSSFDIRSSKVCWSIPTDIALYLDFSFKSSESNCSYFVDSSRVFIHTQETKPVGFRYQKYEVCENRFGYLDEELIPSRLVTEIYFDPVEGCPINPLMSHCDEILIIRTVHGQLTSYKQETNIVLWYERVDTFYIWIVSREEGLKFQKEQLRLYQSRQRTVW